MQCLKFIDRSYADATTKNSSYCGDSTDAHYSSSTHPPYSDKESTNKRYEWIFFLLEGLCHCFTGHCWCATYKIESKESSKCYFQLVPIEKSPEDWEDIRMIKNRVWRNSATAAVFSCSSRGSPVFGTCQGWLFLSILLHTFRKKKGCSVLQSCVSHRKINRSSTDCFSTRRQNTNRCF